jgi:hypothetical protein
MLRVRDPRITGNSLTQLYEKKFPPEDNSHGHGPRTGITEQRVYSWKRAAKLLGVAHDDIRRPIAEGELRLLDTFVTDRAFEDFCRKHGDESNLSLMDTATRKWLMVEYGVPEEASSKSTPRAQKRALILRECRCGRKIASNVYFRHCGVSTRSSPAGTAHVVRTIARSAGFTEVGVECPSVCRRENVLSEISAGRQPKIPAQASAACDYAPSASDFFSLA